MPNKKKQPKNAFYFYMLKVQDEYQRGGVNYKLSEIAEMAGPGWRALSPKEKQIYEEQAMIKRSTDRANGRLDCYGNSLDAISQREEEEKDEERKMTEFIEQHLKYLGSKDDVAKESFFFISTKIFCLTDEEEYIPAELGVVEYSLADGIIQHYHRFIDPGPLPRGYSFKCKEHSERTHRIPIQNFKLADKDYRRIFSDILAILNPDGTSVTYPPLYCPTEEIKQTKFILQWLQYDTRRSFRPLSLKVYDVAQLMYELYRYSSSQLCSVGLIQDFLCSTSFTFNAQTCCHWHWEEDNPEHCALGMAKKICYIFSDHLCEHFGIVPLANRHLPEREADDSVNVLPPSAFKINRRPTPVVPQSPQPLGERSPTILSNVKSKFNFEEEKHYVPSAQSSLQPSSSWKSSQTSCASPIDSLQPLRQPKHKSFVAATVSGSQPQFKLEDSDFPELESHDDTRSDCSHASSFNDSLTSFKSSAYDRAVSPSNSLLQQSHKVIPIGRGIGRGRFLQQK